MQKVMAVIRREFLERVRTRAFLIGTFLFPVLLVGFWALPILLSNRDTGPKTVAVVDATAAGLGEAVAAVLGDAKRNGKARYAVQLVPAAGRVEAVRDSLVARTGLTREEGVVLSGLLVLTDSALSEGRSWYLGANVSAIQEMRVLDGLVERTVHRARLAQAGIDTATIAASLRRIDLETQKVTEGKLTGESGGSTFLLAYAMDFILYMGLILYGVQVMSSIVEEKSNRISEVLASSLTPFQMMMGKVLGVGSVGLLQIGIWAGTAMGITAYGTAMARALGFGGAADAGAPSLPVVSPQLLIVFLLFFVLGFLLFASAYAAVGAMCNSTQETQQANAPITMIIAVGFISLFALLDEPNGTLARVLTFVPLLSPYVVPIRYSINPLPWWEVAASAAVTVVGLVAVTWVASRIYRVGILAYGKRPTLGELWRWVRTA